MREVKTLNYEGKEFSFYDSTEESFAVANILRELPGYQIETIPFEPGDVMIDIGTHCGVISIAAAKCFPDIEVYSFEPYHRNFDTLLENIKVNEVDNIHPFQMAVTADGRDLQMKVRHRNTGSGSAYKDFDGDFDEEYQVSSITLDQIFKQHDIDRCKLLKLDCEGAEHELILEETCLDRVDNLVGEFHMNQTLRSLGYSIENTVKHAKQRVSGRVVINKLRMVD